MTRDHHTPSERDAGLYEQNRAYPEADDRDWDDGPVEVAHDHREGAICLICVLEQQTTRFKAAIDTAEQQDLFVCDGCECLYDLGCTHGFWLCEQCKVGRCADCRVEAADDQAETLRERLRERWGGEGA